VEEPATTGPVGDDYTHTYGRALDPDVFAVEVVYSDELANSRMMTGCRCSSWSMDFPLNSEATIDLTMLGLTYEAETTHTALSDRTDRTHISTNDCTALTLNSVDLLATGTVQGLSISGENSLTTRYTFGSASPNALMGNSQGTVTASLTVHVDSTTYNDYQVLHEAGTEVTLVATFTAATGETFTVEPRNVILVEGILIFVDPDLRRIFDVKIFVDTDADERLIRRIRRDTKVRGRPLDEMGVLDASFALERRAGFMAVPTRWW
jgi:hypothetical protein